MPPSSMVFLPEFPPYFEKNFGFPTHSGRNGLGQKCENPYNNTCKNTEGDIGLAVVHPIAKGVSRYARICDAYA